MRADCSVHEMPCEEQRDRSRKEGSDWPPYLFLLRQSERSPSSTQAERCGRDELYAGWGVQSWRLKAKGPAGIEASC